MSLDRSNDTRMLARHLGAITRSVRIHDVGNRAVARLVDWSARDLTALHAQGGDARVELDMSGTLVVNNTPVRMRRDLRNQLVPLAQMLRDLDSGGFRLTGPVAAAQLTTLFQGLGTMSRGTSRPAAQQWLDQRGSQCLQLLPPRTLSSGMMGGPGEAVRLSASTALQAYVRAVLAVQESLNDGSFLRVPPTLFRAAQVMAELSEDEPRFHVGLTALKEDMEYEVRHPVHSMIFAMALAKRIGLPRQLLVEVGIATALAASLPDQPTADEVMELALEMLQSSRLTLARARRMLTTFESRAGMDRSGPPHIQLDAPVHLFSRIAAIAIEFDILTTTGNGRRGLLADEALQQMQDDISGRFDHELLRLFAATVGRYPLGTAVMLDSGEVAVVVHTRSEPEFASRPLVRVVRDDRGREIKFGPLLDLSDDAATQRITGAVDAESLGIDTKRVLFG